MKVNLVCFFALLIAGFVVGRMSPTPNEADCVAADEDLSAEVDQNCPTMIHLDNPESTTIVGLAGPRRIEFTDTSSGTRVGFDFDFEVKPVGADLKADGNPELVIPFSVSEQSEQAIQTDDQGAGTEFVPVLTGPNSGEGLVAPGQP